MLNDIKYLSRLLWQVAKPGRVSIRGIGLALVVLFATGAMSGGVVGGMGTPPEMPVVDVLANRADTVISALANVERTYQREVEPIERVLLAYRNDVPLARKVAVSLVREGRRANLEPRLLLAVLLVENPWLEPTARSSVGATGLMQVMPLHRGHWKKCPGPFESIDTNICYGAQIFASYLKSEKGNVERALLRYNGCVRGTNTPHCHTYPSLVYANAGRASIMAWRGRASAAAP